MKTQQVGSIVIQHIGEIDRVAVPAAQFFSSAAAPETIAHAREWLDGRFIDPDTGDMMISFHSYVIRTKGRNILVDTCHGNDKTRTGAIAYANMLKTDYLGNLASVGLKPGDIDVVLCTHLHYDHVGWNTRLENGRWAPTFPNAKYLMTKVDYEHFAHLPTGALDEHHLMSFRDSVLPVIEAGQADLVETDHSIERDLDDGLWLEGAPGHTPGSVVLHAKAGGARALFSGDVVHHPIQLAEPTLHVVGEHDSAQAIETRRKLIRSHADTGTVLLTAHFPAPTAGCIVSKGESFRFQFAPE